MVTVIEGNTITEKILRAGTPPKEILIMKISNILLTAVTSTMDTITEILKQPTIDNYHGVCEYFIETVEKDWGLAIKPLETRLYSIGGVKSIETRITVVYPAFGGGYRDIRLKVWVNDEEIGWDLIP